MKVKELQYPVVNPFLFYGKIVKWQFRPSLTSMKNSYAYRFTVFFENGEKKEYQRSGFKTKKAAEAAKEETIVALDSKTFVPFNIETKDFFEFWLYYYMIDERHIAYNTYYTYRNIIYNYIFKALDINKTKKKITSLTEKDFKKLEQYIDSKGKSNSLKRTALSVMSRALQYAQSRQCISINPAENFQKYHKIQKRRSNKKTKKREVVILTLEQCTLLIDTCKANFSELYIPLLFAMTAGLRISEVAGLRYKDVNFEDKTITVHGQIGSTLDRKGKEEQMATQQYIAPKTLASKRTVYIPQFLCTEILNQHKKYKRLSEIVPGFYDLNYISCQPNGKPITKRRIRSCYNKLLLLCDLPKMHFHDLRHTYATLLDDAGISEKLISNMLGHVRQSFTRKTYVDKSAIPCDLTSTLCNIAPKLLTTTK